MLPSGSTSSILTYARAASLDTTCRLTLLYHQCPCTQRGTILAITAVNPRTLQFRFVLIVMF
jgi:hypothetical protein